MAVNNKRLLLVDTSSFVYRAFHALPDLRSRSGHPTGAITGMINMLRRLRQEWPADFAACVFDPKGATFRDEIYPEYKANRSAMPDDLRAQIPVIFDAVRALGWPVIVVDGLEADDVIGTLAHQAQSQGLQTVIATGDKDLAQLVNDQVLLVDTMSRDGGPAKVTDRQAVIDKFGVPPERIIDYLALVGDAVDNVPGVEKVGPKTAAKWLASYDTLEGVMANASEIGGVVGENLRKALDWLPTARTLVTVKCDADLSAVVPRFEDTLVYGPIASEVLDRLRDEFDLDLISDMVSQEPEGETAYKPITPMQSHQVVKTAPINMRTLFLDTETTGLSEEDEIVELAIVDEFGQIVFNSLINPKRPIPALASKIHGIDNYAVESAPTLAEVWDELRATLQGTRIVIYNAAFDRKFFPDRLDCAAEIQCAMLSFSDHVWRKDYGKKRRFKLQEASSLLGFEPFEQAHSALVDTLECRRIWGAIHNLGYNDRLPPKNPRYESKTNARPSNIRTTAESKPELPRFISEERSSSLGKPALPPFAKETSTATVILDQGLEQWKNIQKNRSAPGNELSVSRTVPKVRDTPRSKDGGRTGTPSILVIASLVVLGLLTIYTKGKFLLVIVPFVVAMWFIS